MADIIKLVLPGELSSESPVAQSTAETGANSSGGGSSDGALSAKDVVRGAKKVMAYTGIKQIADSYLSFEVSTVNLKTGAAEYQQKLQFAYGEGSQLAGSIGAIAMGAVMGGPAGAGVAAAGVGLSYLMKFIGWQQNAVKLDMEQNLENVSIGMANIRAGTAGRRSPNQ